MFSNKPSAPPSVGPLENEVMHVLWERGSATADDVRQQPSRAFANPVSCRPPEIRPIAARVGGSHVDR